MGIFRFIIRISAFLGKEIAEILRQPRLILTLVLGPFLILLLFGLGYRQTARSLRTLFVVAQGQQEGQLADQIKEYATSLGPQLIFAGVTSDENAARAALLHQQVDLVVLTPPDPYGSIQQNQQATFTLLHHEIDPLQVDYIKYFGEVYVAEVNRRVLQSVAEQGQARAAESQKDVQAARANVAAIRTALQAGDQAAARQHQQDLSGNVSALELGLGTAAGILGGVRQSTGQSGASDGNQLQADLNNIRAGTSSLGGSTSGDVNAQVQRAAQLEADLTRLDSELTQFRQLDPHVLVQPFRSEAQSLAAVQATLSGYFAPSVIVLLLQHLAVTFAALSIVRESRLGAMELFRVAPLSALETLLGKYLSYLIFGSILAAILSLLLIYALHVPLLGDPRWYAAVLAALLFTSLGLGFFISLIAQTDSQAVQYSMIILLSSVFFTGFMLSLENLMQPIRLVSWLLPATYGISLLQNVMLRGTLSPLWQLEVLTAYGGVLFLVSWILLHRKMARA
jgi:ABC-2 type transport system permease protein